MTTPLERLNSGYYNSEPVSEANPGGFADGGHVVNFPAALQDIAAVAESIVLDNEAIGEAGDKAAQAANSAAAAMAAKVAAEALLASAVVGPESAVADHLVQFDGTTGKLVKGGRPIGAGGPSHVPDLAAADSRFISFNKVDAPMPALEGLDLTGRLGSPHFAIGARSNLLLRSAEFDNGSWTKLDGVTATANAYNSPADTATGDRLNAGGAASGVQQVVASTVLGAACFSVWLFSPSAEGGEQVELTLDANGATADAWSKIVTLKSGWARYFVGGTFGLAHTQKRVRILTGGQVVGAWGGQLDLGTEAPRGYHPTSSSAQAARSDISFFTGVDGTFGGTFSGTHTGVTTRSQTVTAARAIAAAWTNSSASSAGTPIRWSPSIHLQARVWNGAADVPLNNYIEVVPITSGAAYDYVWRVHDGARSLLEVEGGSGQARAAGKRLLNEDDLAAINIAMVTAINNLIGGAPEALDTLKEIADALAAGGTTGPAKATGAELRALVDDAKYLTPKSVADAMAYLVLTDAATVSIDLSAGSNFRLLTTAAVGTNRTLTVEGGKPGQTFSVEITTDAANRTASYNTIFKFPGGVVPALTTTSGRRDRLVGQVTAAGTVDAQMIKDVR